MTQTIETTTLIAYVDGELDPIACQELEQAMSADPQLRDRVLQLCESTALIRAAYNHAVYSPKPITKNSEPESGKQHTAEIVSLRRKKLGFGWLPTALAASLIALMTGVIIGYWLNPMDTVDHSEHIAELRAETLNHGLENSLSGQPVAWQDQDSKNRGNLLPVRTFRSKTGEYCREFEETRWVGEDEHREGGIACRQENGQWTIRVRYYPE